MDGIFSEEERKELRGHGVEIFAGRIIFDAQPPMKKEEMEAVERLCNGKLPQQLIDLWSQTAGGRLDYDLTVEMHGRQESISWCELFFNGSNTYNDLAGWIDHERDILLDQLEEAKALDDTDSSGMEIVLDSAGNPLLDYLPIGGFEYCDRIYVYVKEGKDYGKVVAWKQGLPPAWSHAMHEDGIASVAPDLQSAFKILNLHENPRQPVSDYYAGQDFKEFLDSKVEADGIDKGLVEKLMDCYSEALVDWRTALDQEELSNHPDLARLALQDAIKRNDSDLLQEIFQAKVDFEQPIQGEMFPTTFAMNKSCFSALKTMVDLGVSVTPNILSDIFEFIPVDVTIKLLERGAQPTCEAVARCASLGAKDSANEIAKAYKRAGGDVARDSKQAKQKLLKSLEESLKKHRTGQVYHFLGEEGLKNRIDSLKEFQLKL